MKNNLIKAIILFSGGLDSTLAVRILQKQGIEVEGLNFRTPFGCCREPTHKIAQELGLKVTYLNLTNDYLRVIENPKYNYGRSVNPCVDCRIHMFRIAKRFMIETNAHFIVSGEIVGQRPNSQRKDCLKAIENNSNLQDLILRPLCAKLLPPTLPERNGWVNREKLYAFHGRGRRGLIELGKKLGLTQFPTPSIGCLLTDKNYGSRVRDMWEYQPQPISLRHYELLKIGRHFRLGDHTKIIIGKNEKENKKLKKMALPGMTYLVGENYIGPCVLITSLFNPKSLNEIQTLLTQYIRDIPSKLKMKKITFDPIQKEECIELPTLIEVGKKLEPIMGLN